MAKVSEKQPVQVKIPDNVSVLYSDSTFLTINEYGVVLDFAQRQGPTNQQKVVARVGMSHDHARVLVEKLANLLVRGKLKTTQVTKGRVKRRAVN